MLVLLPVLALLTGPASSLEPSRAPAVVSVVAAGPKGEAGEAMRGFLATHAIQTWGRPDARRKDPQFVVEVTATSSITVDVVVRGEGVALADHTAVLEPRELALREAWDVVRSTIEREAAAETALWQEAPR